MVKGLFVKIPRPFVFVCHVEAEATEAQKPKGTAFNENRAVRRIHLTKTEDVRAECSPSVQML